MKAIFLNFFIFMGVFVSEAVFAETKTEEFTYKVGGKEYQGFIADGAPEGKKVPGVIIVHEWWGHNAYPRSRAKQLADLGYVAFAIDMFGKGKVATHPKDAQKFAGESMKDPKAAQDIFNKALSILKERKDVDPSKIAAIGYCYGGAVVLTMAKMGSDMDLVASFHGSLPADYSIPKRKDNPKVLIFNGADDPFVSAEAIEGMKSALTKAGVDYDFVNYNGAKHAFTNPLATENGKKFEIPLEYNEKADKDSWNKFVEELKKL